MVFVNSITELLDASRAIADSPVPNGRNVGIVQPKLVPKLLSLTNLMKAVLNSLISRMRPRNESITSCKELPIRRTRLILGDHYPSLAKLLTLSPVTIISTLSSFTKFTKTRWGTHSRNWKPFPKRSTSRFSLPSLDQQHPSRRNTSKWKSSTFRRSRGRNEAHTQLRH